MNHIPFPPPLSPAMAALTIELTLIYYDYHLLVL